MAPNPPRVVLSEDLFDALAAAGVVDRSEPIARIVIDAQAGHLLRLHLERFGDERILQVVPSLAGVQISTIPARKEDPDGNTL